MCGFVRERVSLAIVRSNSLILCGPRYKDARIWQRPELTDGGCDGTACALAGLNQGDTYGENGRGGCQRGRKSDGQR